MIITELGITEKFQRVGGERHPFYCYVKSPNKRALFSLRILPEKNYSNIWIEPRAELKDNNTIDVNDDCFWKISNIK